MERGGNPDPLSARRGGLWGMWRGLCRSPPLSTSCLIRMPAVWLRGIWLLSFQNDSEVPALQVFLQKTRPGLTMLAHRPRAQWPRGPKSPVASSFFWSSWFSSGPRGPPRRSLSLVDGRIVRRLNGSLPRGGGLGPLGCSVSCSWPGGLWRVSQTPGRDRSSLPSDKGWAVLRAISFRP